LLGEQPIVGLYFSSMSFYRPHAIIFSALFWVHGMVVGFAGEEEVALASKPNVILIVSDDQGYGDLACHGNKTIKTPNLDLLHKQSTRLTNFHVNPTCSPTRAALMTGRYANATGVWRAEGGRSILRSDEATIARVFADAGYSTAMFGKWHLGDNYPSRPEDKGFHHVVRHEGSLVGGTPDAWGNNHTDDSYSVNGERKKFVGYSTDVWFDEALKFIENKKDTGKVPFFAYVSTSAGQAPFVAPEEYKALYAGNDEVPDPAFYAMISNLDDNVGTLMKKLDEWNLSDNTILIFMSDNGSAVGEIEGKGFNAAMRGVRGSPYEGGHRVPFFVRWPGGGVTAGRDIHTLTAHIDVLPTLMDFCKISKRPEGAPLMQGKSLVPLLSGDAQRWAPRTLVTDAQEIEQPQKWRGSAVMTDRWRLVNGKELYDFSADPGEKKDVANENEEVVQELRAEYEKWWVSVSARFDEVCPIVIRGKEEKPVGLTAHDWHGDVVASHQDQIKKGIIANGGWALDLEEAGKYEIELTRWPIELNAPINGTVEGGVAIVAEKARIVIGGAELSKPIPADARSVKFEVKLAKGAQRLQTWFIDERGENPVERGAYYVYLKRL